MNLRPMICGMGTPLVALLIGFYAQGGDTFGASRQSYLLLENGRARCRIVQPKAPKKEEAEAAKLLNDMLAEIGDVTLDVVTDGAESVPGVIDIHVGQTDWAKRDGALPATLDADGFVVRPIDEGTLVLLGGRSVSTYYAVTEFLERYAGMLWVWPGELGTVVPKASRLEVTVRDQISEPAFGARRFSGMGGAKMRNYRVHLTQREVRSEFHHNVWRVLKDSTWKKHPEYFSKLNGKRWKPTPNKSNWQACTSNPEVVDLFIAAAKTQFRKRPWVVSFSVSQNDGGGFCTCDNCLALDIPEATGISDRYFTFLNAVADGVATTHPGKRICCLAYGTATREVPRRLKLRPNTMIYAVVPTLTDAHEDIRKWSKAAPNLGVYFWLHGKAVPKFYPHRFATYLQFLLENNVRGVYAEVYQEKPDRMSSFALDGPRVWMMGKLLWNPTADIDALMTHFCSRFYGQAAAKPMRRYYQQCELAWERRENPYDFGRDHRNFELGNLYSTEDVDIMEACINDALEVASPGPEHQRLEKLQKALAKTALWIREYDFGNTLAKVPVNDTASADRVVALVQQTAARSADMVEHGLSLFGTLPPECEMGIDEAFARITEALGNKATEYWKAKISTHPEIFPFIDTQLRLIAGNLPNLILNSGFESRAEKAGDVDAALNWEPFNAAGWSKWLRPGTPGKVAIGRKAGRSGTRAVVVEGCVAACALQKRTVQHGERYRISCWAKTTPASEEGPEGAGTAGRLAIKWMDSKGKWLSRIPPVLSGLPRGTTEWQKLSCRLTVPEQVGQLVIMLSTKKQATGEKLWFDDVVLEQLHELPPK
ncbi:MAG: DUF4838 domain-containing protein [Lentisphaerae bacterium]|nr:DUF4838 domain-containing protein [Lentisphaerota bacterium]